MTATVTVTPTVDAWAVNVDGIQVGTAARKVLAEGMADMLRSDPAAAMLAKVQSDDRAAEMVWRSGIPVNDGRPSAPIRRTFWS